MWNIIRSNKESNNTRLSVEMVKKNPNKNAIESTDRSNELERPLLLGGITITSFSSLPETKTVHGKDAPAQNVKPTSEGQQNKEVKNWSQPQQLSSEDSIKRPRTYEADKGRADEAKSQQRGKKENSAAVPEQTWTVKSEKEVANVVSHSEGAIKKGDAPSSSSESMSTVGIKKRAQGFIWQVNKPTDTKDNTVSNYSSNDATLSAKNSLSHINHAKAATEPLAMRPSQAANAKEQHSAHAEVSPQVTFRKTEQTATANTTQELLRSTVQFAETTLKLITSSESPRNALKVADENHNVNVEILRAQLTVENLKAQILKLEHSEKFPIRDSSKSLTTSLSPNFKDDLRHDLRHELKRDFNQDLKIVPTSSRAVLKIMLTEQNVLHIPVSRQLLSRTRASEETAKNSGRSSQTDRPRNFIRQDEHGQSSRSSEPARQNNSSMFTLNNSRLPERRYIFGSEFAIAAVIASAGIARVRVRSEAIKISQTPTDKLVLSSAIKQATGDRHNDKNRDDTLPLPVSIGFSRGIGGNIASFAIPQTIMNIVRSESAYLLCGSKRLEQIIRDGQKNTASEIVEEISIEKEERAGLIPSTLSDWQRSWRELSTGFAVSTNGFDMLELFDFKLAEEWRLVDANVMAIDRGQSLPSKSSDEDESITAATSSLYFKRPTILITDNQTFVSIAEEYFNDSNIAWLIADLNRLNTRETEIEGKRVIAVSSRQSIVLPVWEDIVSFYRNHPKGITAENIVTIIETAEIDRELATSIFDRVLEHKNIRNNSDT